MESAPSAHDTAETRVDDDATSGRLVDDPLIDDELLIEEISIDGMCGVY